MQGLVMAGLGPAINDKTGMWCLPSWMPGKGMCSGRPKGRTRVPGMTPRLRRSRLLHGLFRDLFRDHCKFLQPVRPERVDHRNVGGV